jgi:L-rhamnose mutarotase
MELHADSNPGVRALLSKYHLSNFSIFLQKIGNEYYEFGYYEYRGLSLEEDLANLAGEQQNIEWLQQCDPMQIPLDGARSWTEMQQIYYNE